MATSSPPSLALHDGRDRGCPLARAFLTYRAFLAITLATLFYSDLDNSFLGQHNAELFSYTVWIYGAMVLGSIIVYHLYTESCENQTYLMVFLDIPAIILMTLTSGGISTGLSLLLGVSIAFGGAIMRGRAVLVFSAMAALALLGAEVYSDLNKVFPNTHYTQAGFMGLSFFAMAIMAEMLARRLRETERLASQREIDLADLAQINQYIIEHIETGIIVVDMRNRLRAFNEAAYRLLGMPDAQRALPLSNLSGELFHAFTQWRRGQIVGNATFAPKGAPHQLRVHFVELGSVTPVGALIFIDDVSEWAERAHQMKLASLGRLVASIAHEIRNPLGAISHAEQLLRESENLDAGDLRLTEIIHRHSQRVNTIVEDMLQFSRRGAAAPEAIELRSFLQAVVSDLRQLFALEERNVRILGYETAITLMADPKQCRQIFENLLGNSVVHFDRERSALRVVVRSGLSQRFGTPYLDICDNGPGIAHEHEGQVFDPFFTTSPQGTGLGLFVTKELCEANRMRLEYRRPKEGRGCCFRVIFPKSTLIGDNDGQT